MREAHCLLLLAAWEKPPPKRVHHLFDKFFRRLRMLSPRQEQQLEEHVVLNAAEEDPRGGFGILPAQPSGAHLPLEKRGQPFQHLQRQWIGGVQRTRWPGRRWIR